MAVKLVSGLKIGRLTLLRIMGHKKFPSRKKSPLWQCLCECGGFTVVDSRNLCTSHTKSCGCWKIETAKNSHTTHGHYRGRTASRLRRIWNSMRQRCTNPNCISYKHYGARGIMVLWSSFEDFLRDMEATHQPHLSIDRKDSNGHYCKENCKWSTSKEQTRNKTNNRIFTVQGRTACLEDLSEFHGIKPMTVAHRLKVGWSVEDAFLKPVGKCYGPRPKEVPSEL